MMQRAKTVEFHIYAPEDLRQKWYVEWYDTTRRRKYGRINREATYEGRMASAKALVAALKAERIRKHSKAELAMVEWERSQQPRWRKKTQQQYRSIISLFTQYLNGREPTPDLVTAYLFEIESHKHPTTYNRTLSMLKRILKAIGYGYLLEDYKRLRSQSTPVRYFQAYQAKRIMRKLEADDAELALAVKFIYYCFVRPGELRMVKVGDLMLEDGEIRLPGHVTKNKKTRFAVIPKQFLPELLHLMERPANEYLFQGRKAGQPVGANHFYRKHQAHIKELGFGEGYTLYSWRHTSAVTLHKAGYSIKEIQMQMGHHSAAQTDEYLRQLGVKDLGRMKADFPSVWD